MEMGESQVRGTEWDNEPALGPRLEGGARAGVREKRQCVMSLSQGHISINH